MSELQDEVDRKTAELEAARRELASIRERAADEQIEPLKAQLAALQKRLAGLRSDNERRERALKTQQEKITALTDQLTLLG